MFILGLVYSISKPGWLGNLLQIYNIFFLYSKLTGFSYVIFCIFSVDLIFNNFAGQNESFR